MHQTKVVGVKKIIYNCSSCGKRFSADRTNEHPTCPHCNHEDSV